MSGAAGAAPPTAVLGRGLDMRGWWGRTGRLDQTSGRHPPAAAAAASQPTKTPLRLPSLVAGPRRRSGMVRLSLSEPSLFIPNENNLFEGLSGSRRSGDLKKRQAPLLSFSKSSTLLPSKTCPRPLTSNPHQPKPQQVQTFSRPTYIHFSHGIQPCTRPRPARRHSHNPTPSSERMQGDPRRSAVQHRNCSFEAEPLSVVGKPCLLSCGQRSSAVGPAASGPARTQLHVFLPSETDGEEADSESVDEGFMDELDNKIGALKRHQRAMKSASYRS